MKQDAVKMLIRMPPDLKSWLEREAARNLSSQGSEIVRELRHRMETERPEKVADCDVDATSFAANRSRSHWRSGEDAERLCARRRASVHQCGPRHQEIAPKIY